MINYRLITNYKLRIINNLKSKIYNLKFVIHNSQSGFTLVEMITVVFIIGILSTVSIANFRQGEKRKRVALAADVVTNGLRTAQNYSLSGKKTNDANGACRIPSYFYTPFLYAAPTTFPINADNNCSGTDIIESYTLPANTRLKNNGMTMNGVVCSAELSLMFTLPFGVIKGYCSTDYIPFTTATIIVESTDGSVSRTVTIDGVSGRIGE